MLAKAQPAIIADKLKLADQVNRLDLERLRGALLVERSSFLSHWEELGRFIFPRRTRFYSTDTDRGNRRNMSIINSRGGLAARNCRGGMMSAFTSPSRPWFRLTTMDPDLEKYEPVKEWLYQVTRIEHEVFLRSNLYTSLQTIYGDMEVFGTAAMLLEEDFTGRVIHTYPFVIGSYYLFADDKLKINGFMRDFRMTVRQIVEKFGIQDGTNNIDWTNISELVHGLWNAGTTESWIDISHAVVPNPKWVPGSPLSLKKRYLSIYYERGTSGSQYTISDTDTTKVLQKRGYDKFRVMAPRWEVSGEDIYGTYCPGMEALGDIQQLQMHERRGSQALEKSINPPMVGPAVLRTQKSTVLPGDITYLDNMGVQGADFKPAYQISPNFQELANKSNQIEARIKECFFDDLWHIISNLDKGNVTAEEIRALKEEKLQDIGPVVDHVNQDLLDPIVEQTFDFLVSQRLLPPPPPELSKHPLRIQYTSLMAQAQKALSAASTERFVAFAQSVKNLEPERQDVLDKVNVDELFDHYSDSISLQPGVLLDDDQVAKIRAQRQQAQAAQQKLAAAEQASKAAKNLAAAPTDSQNALTDLIDSGNAGNLLPSQ